MTIRFQVDVNLDQIILRAARRREPTLDFQIAETASPAGLPDPEVLARTAEDGRILVMHGLQTMSRHFAAFITTRQSPGLRLIPQRLPIASAVDNLLLIWSTMAAEEGRNLMWYLPHKVWQRGDGALPVGNHASSSILTVRDSHTGQHMNMIHDTHDDNSLDCLILMVYIIDQAVG